MSASASASGGVEVLGVIYSFLKNAKLEKAASALVKEGKIDVSQVKPTDINLSAYISTQLKANSKTNGNANNSSDSSSSDSSDSDSESEEEKPVAAKKPATPAPASKPVAATKKEESSSSDSSESDDSDSDEEESKPATKPTATPAKSTPAKKDESDDDDSSSTSSSSSEESEDEAPPAKTAKTSTVATPSAPATNNKRKAESSSSESESSSSDSDSSDSDDDDEPKKEAVKSTPSKAPDNKKLKINENGDAKKPIVDTQTSASGEHKVFVKGLPWKASEAEVKDFFKSCGKITSVEIPILPDGKSTGTAFVRFADRAGVDAALALEGSTWPGTERWLSIQEGRDKPDRRTGGPVGEKPEGCDTVFVGNLPWDVEESNLRDLFSSCGEIVSVRFATSEDGSFKGFGHVQFADGDSTTAAVQLSGSNINDRAIRVDFAPPRNRDSLGGGGRGRGGAGGRGGRGGPSSGGRGGRGGRGSTPVSGNKNKGAIAVSTGKKMTFDD